MKVGLPNCELSLHSDSAESRHDPNNPTADSNRIRNRVSQRHRRVRRGMEDDDGGRPSFRKAIVDPPKFDGADQAHGSDQWLYSYMYFPHRVSQAQDHDTPSSVKKPHIHLTPVVGKIRIENRAPQQHNCGGPGQN